MSTLVTSAVASQTAILPKELLGLVLAYHGPDPREMVMITVTNHDMGMKWHHITWEVSFNFQRIEQVFGEFLKLAAHFGCQKFVYPNIREAASPVYAIVENQRVANISLLTQIRNPIQSENPALTRIRGLLQTHSIIDTTSKDPVKRSQTTVIIDAAKEKILTQQVNRSVADP